MTRAAAVAALALACSVGGRAAAGEPSPARPPAEAPGAAARTASPLPPGVVDLNSASRAALMTVPGIGSAQARAIIAGRPWRVKADLVEKGIIPEGVYVAIRRKIAAVPPAAPHGASR